MQQRLVAPRARLPFFFFPPGFLPEIPARVLGEPGGFVPVGPTRSARPVSPSPDLSRETRHDVTPVCALGALWSAASAFTDSVGGFAVGRCVGVVGRFAAGSFSGQVSTRPFFWRAGS